LRYHSIEDWGTKYDEVDGWFFALDEDDVFPKIKHFNIGQQNIVANLKSWVFV
jgi:hypothetical protein